MPQQPAVTLTNEERTALENFVHRGKANAHTLTRARILLKSADGWSTATIAEALDVCQAEGNWELEVVERTPGVRGFAVRAVTLDRGTDRSVGFRGTAAAVKDDERKVQTSETLIEVAMIRLLIARQGLQAPDLFHTRRQQKRLVRAARPSHAPLKLGDGS